MFNPIFCEGLGRTPNDPQCCLDNDQNNRVCQENLIDPGSFPFKGGCNLTQNCLQDCQDPHRIYSSVLQDNLYEGNGHDPIERYLTCVNVPGLATHLRQGGLSPEITSEVAQYLPRNASDASLQNITNTVTDCLVATCKNARHPRRCQTKCVGVKLLRDSHHPNVVGINQCLHALCTGSYNSLPYADQDVVGIGVFASYTMQCGIVFLLWLGLTCFELYKPRDNGIRRDYTLNLLGKSESQLKNTSPTTRDPSTTEKCSHRQNFEGLIEYFHNAQCYFSATIQIAALNYGIFKRDMLTNFLLLPLSTNGILPVVFGYVLLLRCHRADKRATILTIACWTLASTAYWILYSHLIPFNSAMFTPEREALAYQQFMFKVSALDACGGYSALAVCPYGAHIGTDDLVSASRKLRVLTPVIWSFSTLCLLVAVEEKTRKWLLRRKYEALNRDEQDTTEENHVSTRSSRSTMGFSAHAPVASAVIYWLLVLCFIAGIGMQLSLLSVPTSLEMTDKRDWGFGQIVAVTIWVPPLFSYFADEAEAFFGFFRSRAGKKAGADD